MVNYNGTDEDDIIDASQLNTGIDRIYPGKGNDVITKACHELGIQNWT